MNPKSCLGLARGFLFLFNLFFFALGSLLLAFGLWVLFDRQSFAAVLGSPLYSLRVWSYVFSGVGTVTMLLGFLGCLGALKEIKAMLLLYFGILLLLFAAQITVAVIVYTQRLTLATKVATYVQELIRGYPAQGPPGDPQESWDAVQQQLSCCGWNGPQDWNPPDGPPGSENRAVACSCLEAPAPNSTHRPTQALPRGRCPTAAPQDIFPRVRHRALGQGGGIRGGPGALGERRARWGSRPGGSPWPPGCHPPPGRAAPRVSRAGWEKTWSPSWGSAWASACWSSAC
ncbi:leukocyte antigen CD37-like [Strix uralensis]|uniref:leukocyte antigen CD37-like n=1 Tax=Strix uralensis TaxID=36305 RepID=UPI003DA75C4F